MSEDLESSKLRLTCVKADALVGVAKRTADRAKRSVGRKLYKRQMKRVGEFIMMVAALAVAVAMVWWAFS